MQARIFTYKIDNKLCNNIHIIEDNCNKLDSFNDILIYKENYIFFVNLNEIKPEDFKIIKKISFEKNSVVAVISSETSLALKTLAYDSGINAFINEKADLPELQAIIETLQIFENTKNKFALFPGNFINNLSTPIFIKNTNGVFTQCNDAFCTFMQTSKENIIGSTIEKFVPNKKARIYEEIDRIVIEKGEEKQHITRLTTPEGKTHSAIVNKSPLYNTSGKIKSLIGIITDISELKKREKELIRQKQKAQEADKLKTSFLSNMSHEIRTPMNAIVGFSQLMALPNLSDEKKIVYIDQINHNANQLLKLIEDIIEVSKIEADKVEPAFSVCYINQMIDELKISFDTHKARLGKTNIELTVHKSEPDIFFNIITDQYRLNQILTNLLGNAIKFTEKGQIKFGYNTIIQDNTSFLEFFVEDTGLGINKNKIEYVFDRFSKIPADKTKLYGGTGLGLSISKSLTELLGGQISVDSTENEGTTFKFTIPKKVDLTNKIEIKPEPKQKFSSNLFDWHNKTILIAEDEEMNYLFLQEVLRNTGINIIWCKNGQEAVEKIKQDTKIDIILMDIKMPYMDGYQATEIIKKIKPDMHIIIQTAYAMNQERDKAFSCGCDDYLEKPVNQEELLEKIYKRFNK